MDTAIDMDLPDMQNISEVSKELNLISVVMSDPAVFSPISEVPISCSIVRFNIFIDLINTIHTAKPGTV